MGGDRADLPREDVERCMREILGDAALPREDVERCMREILGEWDPASEV
jgi:hypothetical protein